MDTNHFWKLGITSISKFIRSLHKMYIYLTDFNFSVFVIAFISCCFILVIYIEVSHITLRSLLHLSVYCKVYLVYKCKLCSQSSRWRISSSTGLYKNNPGAFCFDICSGITERVVRVGWISAFCRPLNIFIMFSMKSRSF